MQLQLLLLPARGAVLLAGIGIGAYAMLMTRANQQSSLTLHVTPQSVGFSPSEEAMRYQSLYPRLKNLIGVMLTQESSLEGIYK